MDGRSTLILATLALLGTALTGCIAPGLTQNSSDVEASALQVAPAADAAAQSWVPGAKLVAVFALEAAEAHDPMPADATPGNGRAPLWSFAYVAPDGTPRAFLAFADGLVLTENETYGAEQYASDATPLQPIAVDSDAALATAALDPTFGPALRGENVTLAQGVADMEGVTGWYFAAVSDAGSAIAVVDAVTGDLLWAHPFDLGSMDFGAYAQQGFAYAPAPQPLRIEKEGTLARGDREEIPFMVDGFGDVARITLAYEKETATDGLQWRLVKLDGEDEEVVETDATGIRPTTTREERTWEVDLDGPGEYRLDLHYR
ncbi:MAG TPA: hypothetical protein VNX21_02425, partial [Candidatus Thermoplasmatota archaeon]|nr:hypothetical protein [Candidatus Thermoplasmatota archaeon]